MLLNQNKEEFRQLVSVVAEHFSLSTSQVEKDYYVTLFLKELSKIDSSINIVFKGGTSLSKCYKVIHRFSEDIDLAVQYNTDKVTRGERKRLKQIILQVIQNLGLKFLNEDLVRSGRDHNEYHVAYDNQFGTDSAIIPHIIIETIVVYKPYPCVVKEVGNFITNYLQEMNESQLIKEFQLEPFSMLIQSVERTFIDKLFAICDYHLEGKYNRYSRHIYDIHMIWSSGILNQEILRSIVIDVVKDRQRYGNRNKSCQPGLKPIEILKNVIESKVYKDDFENVTSQFIYKPVEYDTCIDSLKEIIDSNILPEIVDNYLI
jgi:hypothetical protein